MEYTPVAGTLLGRGDRVTIVISRGPEEEPPVTVTQFVGLNIDQVLDQVRSLGLTIGTVSYFPNHEYAEGIVIWQSISQGEEVEVGTVINFQVSEGPGPQPSADPSPDVTDPVVEPTQDVNAPAGSATVEVDLSPYEGTVTVRIEVGDQVVFNNSVDASEVDTFSRTVSGTGTETVKIYINNQLMRSYQVTFHT